MATELVAQRRNGLHRRRIILPGQESANNDAAMPGTGTRSRMASSTVQRPFVADAASVVLRSHHSADDDALATGLITVALARHYGVNSLLDLAAAAKVRLGDLGRGRALRSASTARIALSLARSIPMPTPLGRSTAVSSHSPAPLCR